MTAREAMRHVFVEFIPDDLEEGVAYVSIPYATMAHKCCCGCRNEVVTPISPTDWTLTFNGQSISLDPSVGNWSLPCQSHYWITRNRVIWARQWSRAEINAGRQYDRLAKRDYVDNLSGQRSESPEPKRELTVGNNPLKSLWQRLTQRFSRMR